MKRILQFSVISLLVLFIYNSCVKEDPVVWTLTVKSSDGGSVSTSGGDYEDGETATITATPSSNYEFVNWSNGSTDNPITITLNNNQTLTANFKKIEYSVEVTVEGEGTVTQSEVGAGKNYEVGSTVELV